MKNFIIILTVLTASFSALAEVTSENVIKLSYQVSTYLEENAAEMSQRELLQIKQKLKGIMDTDIGKPEKKFICDENSRLISSNGTAIADYTWAHECQKGIEQMRTFGAVCDSQSKMINERGRELSSYSWNHECETALKQLVAYKAVCSNGKLVNKRGNELFKYNWNHQCIDGLKQLKKYRSHSSRRKKS